MKLSDLIDDMFPQKAPQSTGMEDEYFQGEPRGRPSSKNPMVKAGVAALNWQTKGRMR